MQELKYPETVTASEIASYVFCPESWRLNELKLPAANRAELDAGTEHHLAKAGAEQIATGTIAYGRILIWLGLAALGLMWLASR